MLVLFDTPAGHALFKLLKPAALSKPDDIWESFTSLESTNKLCACCIFGLWSFGEGARCLGG